MNSTPSISEWWPLLPESARAALSADPRAPLSRDSIVALTAARGVGPTTMAFEGRRADSHLTDDEAEWIEGNA